MHLGSLSRMPIHHRHQPLLSYLLQMAAGHGSAPTHRAPAVTLAIFPTAAVQLKLRGRRPSVPAGSVQVDPLALAAARPWIAPAAADAEVKLLLLIRGPSSSSSCSSSAGLVKKLQELLAAGAAASSSVVVASAGSGSGRRSGREADGQQVLVPLPLAPRPLARGQAAVHRPVASEVMLQVEVLLLDMAAPRRRGSRYEIRQQQLLLLLLLRRRRLVSAAALLGQRLLRLLQHGLQVLALRFDPQLQVSLNL